MSSDGAYAWAYPSPNGGEQHARDSYAQFYEGGWNPDPATPLIGAANPGFYDIYEFSYGYVPAGKNNNLLPRKKKTNFINKKIQKQNIKTKKKNNRMDGWQRIRTNSGACIKCWLDATCPHHSTRDLE